jgi:SAM-dependent methyltransferase
MDAWSLPRENLHTPRVENFPPPPLERPRGAWGALKLALRRFADLQFGSIWRDLDVLLPSVRGSLVDVGCGAQPFRDLLSPDVTYIGVDIAEAKSRFGYEAADTRYFSGTTLPLADAEANVILCTETLEHVLNPGILLLEIRRALCTDGILVMTVPFSARWHFIPHDYWRYTPSGLGHLLSDAGFADIRIYARGGVLAVASYKVLGYVLLLVSGGGSKGPMSLLAKAIGVLLLPLGALSMLAGNVGLRYPGSTDDTLGYTVIAKKR